MKAILRRIKELLTGPKNWQSLAPEERQAVMTPTSRTSKSRPRFRKKKPLDEEIFGDPRIIGEKGVNLTFESGTPASLMSNILADERKSQAQRNARESDPR